MIDKRFYSRLFRLLLDHGLMSSDAMYSLFFGLEKAERFNPRTGNTAMKKMSPRASRSRVATLIRNGYVAREYLRLPGDTRPGRRTGYVAGPRLVSEYPQLVSEMAQRNRAPTTKPLALLRSTLTGALTDAGWTVARTGTAALHLRRYLLDNSSAAGSAALREELPGLPTVPASSDSSSRPVVVDECWSCTLCGYVGAHEAVHMHGGRPCAGPLRALDLVPFDIFYRVKNRKIDAGAALYLSRRDDAQDLLRALPIWTSGQAPLPLLFRYAGPSPSEDVPAHGSLRRTVASALRSAPGYAEFAFMPDVT